MYRAAFVMSKQKDLAGAEVLVESLDIERIIKDAFSMLPEAFFQGKIEVTKSFDTIPSIKVQKSKLIHVLVNLFTNSYHAIRKKGEEGGRLDITVESDENTVRIRVVDNGIGISQQNLSKIFQHGFTTRKKGFGFGLHSCANYMEEMGGKIVAESEGEGKGASMTLMFPIPDLN